MSLHFTHKQLAALLRKAGHAVIENGQLLPEPSRQEMTEQAHELRRQELASQRERLERKFALVSIGCTMQRGVPAIEWVRNYPFDRPDSDMEIDFALPDLQIGVEVNGGQGRGNESGHGSWTGLERDARKQNNAIRKGWRIFWITTSMVNIDNVLPIIDYILERETA